MRRRKTFIGVALIIAVLMLSIGYAATMGVIDLKITGTTGATTTSENFKIKFEGTPTEGTDKNVTANSSVVVTPKITDDHNATLSVSGLTTKNEYVTAVYTVKNESPEVSAVISTGTITNSNSEYFKVTASVAAGSAEVLAGQTTTITVKVELIKTPVANQSSTITIPITATAKAA